MKPPILVHLYFFSEIIEAYSKAEAAEKAMEDADDNECYPIHIEDLGE